MNVINSGDSHWAELVKPYFLTVSNLLDSDPNPLKWVEFKKKKRHAVSSLLKDCGILTSSV